MLIKRVLDYSYSELAFSDSISDVLKAFKQLSLLIGKIDFVFAILFSVMYEEKVWIRYGFNSLDSLLNCLPNVYRISRQTFINFSMAGKMIRYFSISPQIIISDTIHCFTLSLFHRNYSKLKFLYRIHYIWKLDITYEIMLNFRDMTYREFNNFVKEYKKINKNKINERYHRKSFLSKQEKELNYFLNGRPFIVDKLIGLEFEIYKEVRLGHIVGCIYSSNLEFINSVIKYLQDINRKHNVHILNLNHDYRLKTYFRSKEIFYEDQSDKPLCDVDWADFGPDDFKLTVQNIENIVADLNPLELKKAVIDKFQNKTELILAQASLIYLIEHNTELHSSIYDYYIKHNITRQFTLEKDFAIKILDLKLSRYKWLKRIGNSIPYLKQLKCVVNFTGNFLDKLSNLKTVFFYHTENPKLITDAFVIASAKRFRKFAYDRNDLLDDLITRTDYRKAKPILKEVRNCQREKMPITVITLQSEQQINLLNDINLGIKTKDRDIIKKYPEINWESILNLNPILDTRLEDKYKELSHLGLADLFDQSIDDIKRQLLADYGKDANVWGISLDSLVDTDI